MITNESIASGTRVKHKEYGIGIVTEINGDKIYVSFDIGLRIFPFPKAFIKGDLVCYEIKLSPSEKSAPSGSVEKFSIPDALAAQLDIYFEQFPMRWDQEKYLWKSVQTFQKRWDPDASDFSGMIYEATSDADYLMNSTYYSPRDMIVELARHKPSYVISMFKRLFDENIDVSVRAEQFFKDADNIRTEFKGKYLNRNYQTMNAVSTYLWLMYPNKYYFYKYSVAQAVSSKTGLSYDAGSTEAEKMISQFKIMDKISAALRSDPRSRKILDPRLDETLYYDDQLHCMAMDFAFFIRPCYAKGNHNN